ncbi:hypothetical protein CEUSTIGMA_g13261.t1 [Chlamydomonas eustigma]|uniref:Replication protein A C-terminal domain-containing protein n=1 Tax=Chlamydomonas eustigma TaxID=1157962 RepID=A0A250XS30_9CHLO|nr:hypothetical protein CEUSTIGMA_g13261.t1 [Chlamydomonas eustigma]|eukprot:GAX85846.1 hypothetical protein CEUSTIGMA_g13261.t1 [Chlamydomonas eustigma]
MNGFGGYEASGASQFGGGGFVPSPAPGADNPYGDRQKGGSKSAPQTMRNVTIRQILRECEVSSDYDVVDGIPLATFFIVGRIVSRVEAAANIKFKIDDGTGIIEVLHYVEDSNPLISEVAQEWQLNCYVRVCGHLRTLDHKKSMTAFRINLIKDYNEVTYHNLQCIFQHLHLTKGAAPPASAPTSGNASVGYGQKTSSYAQPNFAGGEPKKKALVDVLSVYNQPGLSDDGLSLEAVQSILASRGLNYTAAEITKAVSSLEDEGMLYSTIDNHHRSTAMC